MSDRRQLLSCTRDQVPDMIDWSPSHSRQIWLSNRYFHRERSKHMSCWCSSHTPSLRAGTWSWWIHLNFRSFQTCRRQRSQCRLYPWCSCIMVRIVLWSTLMRICTVIRCENPTLKRQLHYLSQKSQRDSSLEDFSTTSYSLYWVAVKRRALLYIVLTKERQCTSVMSILHLGRKCGGEWKSEWKNWKSWSIHYLLDSCKQLYRTIDTIGTQWILLRNNLTLKRDELIDEVTR